METSDKFAKVKFTNIVRGMSGSMLSMTVA